MHKVHIQVLIYNYFKIIVIGPRRLAGDVRLSQLRGFRGAHRRSVRADPHLGNGSPGAPEAPEGGGAENSVDTGRGRPPPTGQGLREVDASDHPTGRQ